MKFIKNNPGLWFLLASLALGEYWAFKLAPDPVSMADWGITIFLGVCMIMLSMWPVGLGIILIWSVLRWWD